MKFKQLVYLLVVIVFVSIILLLSQSQSHVPSPIIPHTDILATAPPALRGNNEIPARSIAPSKKKIAYAITITKDGPFLDGALVLGFSAQKAQLLSDKYDADLVAFVTPEVQKARIVLAAYGWIIMEKDLPVSLAEITNPDYMNRVCAVIFLVSIS
jgi:hypothetical protein